MRKRRPRKSTARSHRTVPSPGSRETALAFTFAPGNEGSDARGPSLAMAPDAGVRLGPRPVPFSGGFSPRTRGRDLSHEVFAQPGRRPRRIIGGSDERVPITDTSSFPWRAHANLRITTADGTVLPGTAWFMAPKILVTAGHCVFVHNSPISARNGWVRSIAVEPARNGDLRPYGVVVSTNFRTVRGWVERGSEEFDYAAIVLPADIGTRTGYFGLAAMEDEQLRAGILNVCGYPDDKPEGTLWHDSGAVTSVAVNQIGYPLDTARGQSGSPLFRVINGQYIAVGIHAYGTDSANFATRITSEVLNNLTQWAQQAG